MSDSSGAINQSQKQGTRMKEVNWISSSFGLLGQASQSSRRSKAKRPKDQIEAVSDNQHSLLRNQNTSNLSSDIPWVHKYKPVNEHDLVVHKKKIAEVKAWLLERLTSSYKENIGKILLLSGPAGTGKTATVDVLSRELNVQLQEWNSPYSLTNEEYASWKNSTSLKLESQRKQFHDFLLRANKYPSLSLCNERTDSFVQNHKIVLVEDIPNVFQTNIRDFHDILRNFQMKSRNPLIFIISDTYAGENCLYSLFPKRFQLELGITHITFNPIAVTNLTRTMSKVVSFENQSNRVKFKIPSKDVIDVLAAGSSGDIRTCINSLQFHCTNECNAIKKCNMKSGVKQKTKTSQGKKPKIDSKNVEKNHSTEEIFNRDTSLVLFRALGKIHYCKREPLSITEKSKQLPTHLHSKARDTLMINPEAIIERVHVTNETFNLYLHQNYTHFYDDIDDVTEASNFLSDADFVTNQWSSRDIMRDYSSCLAARGLIFANKQRPCQSSISGKWRPLYKPQWFEAIKKLNSNRKTAEELFLDLRYPTSEIFKDVIPFWAKTHVPSKTPSHISFIQMISQFHIQTLPKSSSSAQLTENFHEPVESGWQDMNLELSSAREKAGNDLVTLSQETHPVEDIDTFEENLIEDFSDEDDMFFL